MSPEGQNYPWLKTTALSPSSLYAKHEYLLEQLQGTPFICILCEFLP